MVNEILTVCTINVIDHDNLIIGTHTLCHQRKMNILERWKI